MAASTKTWLNNEAPSVEDDDLNGFKNENNNLILGTGQSLNTSDSQQTHKAVSAYSAVGQFYTGAGIADAYTLAAVAPRIAPAALIDGMRFVFFATAANTGASTVNVAGLGVKNIKNRAGEDLIAGDINTKNLIEIRFDQANDEFVYDGARIHALILRDLSNQSIPNAVDTAVVWDTTKYDSGNIYTGGADEFIIPAGFTRARLRANTVWATNGTGVRRMRPAINGSVFDGGLEPSTSGSSSGGVNLNGCSADFDVTTGDSIKLLVFQSSGGALDLVGVGQGSWFYIELD